MPFFPSPLRTSIIQFSPIAFVSFISSRAEHGFTWESRYVERGNVSMFAYSYPLALSVVQINGDADGSVVEANALSIRYCVISIISSLMFHDSLFCI